VKKAGSSRKIIGEEGGPTEERTTSRKLGGSWSSLEGGDVEGIQRGKVRYEGNGSVTCQERIWEGLRNRDAGTSR